MERWVLSRLMWNPYVPVEQYREEYIRRTYRKAAAPMREFYALIAKTWFSSDRPSNWTDDPVGNASRYIVEAGIDKRIMELLDEAVRLAANDVSTVNSWQVAFTATGSFLEFNQECTRTGGAACCAARKGRRLV